MPTYDVPAVKAALKKITYDNKKFHIALGDIKKSPFGFAISATKLLPAPGGVVGTIEARNGALVVKGTEIKPGHLKVLNAALRAAQSKLVAVNKAPKLDGSPDGDDGTSDELQLAPLLEELNDALQRSNALASPLPPAPFQAIRAMIVSPKPDFAKAKAQLMTLRRKIDQLEQASTASTSRKDMNDAIKSRAEQSQRERKLAEDRANLLIAEWKKIEPKIKTHIVNIAKLRGMDPKVLAAKAKAIKAAVKSGDHGKLSDVTFFLNGIAFVERQARK